MRKGWNKGATEAMGRLRQEDGGPFRSRRKSVGEEDRR
jgi:hypothetical protein